jgi:hypothetical protein
MKEHNIDIMNVQETRVNYTGKESKDGHVIYFASDV